MVLIMKYFLATSATCVKEEIITVEDDLEDTDGYSNSFNTYQPIQPLRASVIQLNPMFTHPTLRKHQ